MVAKIGFVMIVVDRRAEAVIKAAINNKKGGWLAVLAGQRSGGKNKVYGRKYGCTEKRRVL